MEKLAHSLKLLARVTENKYHTLPEAEYNLMSLILKENEISEHQVHSGAKLNSLSSYNSKCQQAFKHR